MRLLCALAALSIALVATAHAAERPRIAFVPLDDRPVTYQLPTMLGAIAGVDVLTPPRETLGRYLEPGDADRILAWLGSDATVNVDAVVASSDMIAYGGLVASRIPDTSWSTAVWRLRALAALRERRSRAFFGVFGTIMRLAPTGVPRLGAAASYFAAGPAVGYITEYANLPDPPRTAQERARAAHLRDLIGVPLLDAYLTTRARDLDVDQFLLQLAAEGAFDRVALGQDDAGPVGLHIRDVHALERTARRFGLGARAAIEPGADELGMVFVGNALARLARWEPAVRVTYSRVGAAAQNDILEYVPIDVTIGRLITLSGARRVAAEEGNAEEGSAEEGSAEDGGDAAIDLFVRLARTSDADEQRFVDAIADALARKRSVAVADLSFLGGTLPEQRALVEELIQRGLAGRIDAFASWNTTANTIGTALATAITVGSARRRGTYAPVAHAQFMLDRYADDYAFHDFVRPQLNADLKAAGVTDETFLLPDVARWMGGRNRALLWPRTLDLLWSIFPRYRDAGLTITLPWERTFETELDVRLRPPARAR